MKWSKLLSLAILSLFLFSCASAGPRQKYQAFERHQKKMIAQFNKANELLDNGQYLAAAKAFDTITWDGSINQLDLIVIYNAGISYYQAGQCELASQRFRKIVRLSRNLAPQIEGRALVQLADIYTCLGEDAKTITTLIEASQGKFGFPADVTLAQIPARLAGAYARIGNAREAQHYYTIAENGLAQLDSSLSEHRDRAQEIAQILMSMGNMQELKPQTLTGWQYLASLRALQKYLYQVVELGIHGSSKAAAKQIGQAYDGVWYYIDGKTAPTDISFESNENETSLNGRNEQLKKLQIAELAVQTLSDLYRQHIPDPNQPPAISDFMTQMHHRELEFRNYIASNIVGTNLTPQALRAQSIKRAGQVLNPNPILEQKALAK